MSAGARADAARVADAQARRAAQTVFDRAVILEAGAGTGKTSTLVARVVCWCVGRGWERAAIEVRARAGRREAVAAERLATSVLEGVVAITFTEAAAAEMATRVTRALAALGRGEAPEAITVAALPAEPEALRERARALLMAIDRLRVSTIHAFCSRLLAANPAEAGVHPSFAVDADETRVEEIVGAAVAARYRREADGAQADDLVTLAAAGIGPDRVATALRRLVAEGVPEAALAGDPFAPERVAALADALRARVGTLAMVLGDRLAEAKAKVPVMVVDALQALLAHLGTGQPATLVDLKALLAAHLPPNLLGRLAEWRRGKLGVEEGERLGEVAAELSAAAGGLEAVCRHVERAEEEVLRAACRVVAPLLAEVRRTMAGAGVVAYADLLSRSRDLLVAHPEVAARERRAITQLVVDEFQDTDALQCEIVAALALDGPETERPGLFLVGDPKQSIYGWRNADLAAYEAFIDRVLAAGGERHTLSVNYRSVPAVLAEVERCLGEVMIREPGVQPAFEPLLVSEARRDDGGFVRGGRAPVEHWVVDPAAVDGGEGDDGVPGVAEAEAGAVAADVVELHERESVAWSDVAILMRATTALPTFLQALRDAGVPYTVERDKAYYRRREILDAAALVRAVLDPADHVALVAWLRSASVGVPDAALLPLWARGFPGAMTELAGSDPAALASVRQIIAAAAAATPAAPGIERVAGWELSLAAAVEALARCRQSFAERPAAELVETLRRATLIEATEAARVLGVHRVANLDRFFRALLAAMEESGSHPQDVLRVMRRALRERRDAEEARLRDAAVDAVRVMTIHKAKGLDFAHVYLVQTARKPRADGVPDAAAARVGGGWEVALFRRPSSGWWQAAARAEQVAAAEEVRTLYVATTRARVRLVTTGPWAGALGAGAQRGGESHLQMLARRRGGVPDAAALVAAAARGNRGPLELGGALWRVPAAGSATGRPRAAAAAPLAEPREVAAQAVALERLAVDAREHMNRPWSAPASAEAHRLLEDDGPAATASTGRSGAGGREVATAAGSLVHHVLEHLDLGSEVATQLTEAASVLPELARSMVVGADPGAVVERAGALLATFAGSPLATRLGAIAPYVVARELAVLLPPAQLRGEEREGASDQGPALGGRPVGFVAGAIDLVYRDPARGDLVIVDYKTDTVASALEVQERVSTYRSQAGVYRRALTDALGLANPPRFELWFLSAGRAVPVE